MVPVSLLMKRINQVLQQFNGLIDLSDVKAKGTQLQTQFLSRALAAYAIFDLAGVSLGEAAKSVVDGFDDNGIDAIFYDDHNGVLWVVQSKWISAGAKAPDLGDVKKFTDGVRDLVDCDFSRFNKKLRSRSKEINVALLKAETRVGVVLCYTGGETS